MADLWSQSAGPQQPPATTIAPSVDPWAASTVSYKSTPSATNTSPDLSDQHSIVGTLAHGLWQIVSNGPVGNLVSTFKRYGIDVPEEDTAAIHSDISNGNYGSAAARLLATGPVSTLAHMAGDLWNASAKYHPLEEAQKGDVAGTANALLGKVPMVGPVLAGGNTQLGAAAKDISKGNYYDAAGNAGAAAGAYSNLLSPEAAERIAPGISKSITPVKNTVTGFFRNDPVILATKAWSPTPTESGFAERIPQTRDLIQDASTTPIKTNAQAIAAAQKALDNHTAALESFMEPARKAGLQIPGDAIVKATADAIPETMKIEKPDQADAILQRAKDAYAGKSFDVDKMNKFRSEKTADLKSFYDANTGNKIAAIAGSDPEAVVKAQRDAAADSLYRGIDPQRNGAGPRQIMLNKSDIIDLKNAAERRQNVATGTKPASQAAAVAGAIPKTLQAVMPGGGHAFNKIADLTSPKTIFQGSVDPLVEKFFKTSGKAPALPVPGPLAPINKPIPGQYNGPQIKGYLGPATQGPQVGPGAKPLVTPAPTGSVPQSGPLPITFPKGSGTNRLLGPGTAKPMGGFATGTTNDLVPVKHPVTGQIEYVSSWTLQKP